MHLVHSIGAALALDADEVLERARVRLDRGDEDVARRPVDDLGLERAREDAARRVVAAAAVGGRGGDGHPRGQRVLDHRVVRVVAADGGARVRDLDPVEERLALVDPRVGVDGARRPSRAGSRCWRRPGHRSGSCRRPSSRRAAGRSRRRGTRSAGRPRSSGWRMRGSAALEGTSPPYFETVALLTKWPVACGRTCSDQVVRVRPGPGRAVDRALRMARHDRALEQPDVVAVQSSGRLVLDVADVDEPCGSVSVTVIGLSTANGGGDGSDDGGRVAAETVFVSFRCTSVSATDSGSTWVFWIWTLPGLSTVVFAVAELFESERSK